MTLLATVNITLKHTSFRENKSKIWNDWRRKLSVEYAPRGVKISDDDDDDDSVMSTVLNNVNSC